MVPSEPRLIEMFPIWPVHHIPLCEQLDPGAEVSSVPPHTGVHVIARVAYVLWVAGHVHHLDEM